MLSIYISLNKRITLIKIYLASFFGVCKAYTNRWNFLIGIDTMSAPELRLLLMDRVEIKKPSTVERVIMDGHDKFKFVRKSSQMVKLVLNGITFS